MSRVDSARIAHKKSRTPPRPPRKRAPDRSSVVASDAFFPFADGLEALVEAGATAVIQPGGSVRDEEVIAAADRRGSPWCSPACAISGTDLLSHGAHRCGHDALKPRYALRCACDGARTIAGVLALLVRMFSISENGWDNPQPRPQLSPGLDPGPSTLNAGSESASLTPLPRPAQSPPYRSAMSGALRRRSRRRDQAIGHGADGQRLRPEPRGQRIKRCRFHFDAQHAVLDQLAIGLEPGGV